MKNLTPSDAQCAQNNYAKMRTPHLPSPTAFARAIPLPPASKRHTTFISTAAAEVAVVFLRRGVAAELGISATAALYCRKGVGRMVKVQALDLRAHSVRLESAERNVPCAINISSARVSALDLPFSARFARPSRTDGQRPDSSLDPAQQSTALLSLFSSS